jgi:hypothetical protein
LFALATVPAGPDEAWRTATYKFYELRDNLRAFRRRSDTTIRRVPISTTTYDDGRWEIGREGAILGSG